MLDVAEAPAIKIRNLDVFYGDTHAIKDVSMEVESKMVTAFIGPSGSGKSTILRAINRMNDGVNGHSQNGEILINGEDIHDPAIDPAQLRSKVGIVFQQPNPFPKSIIDNVAFPARLRGEIRPQDNWLFDFFLLNWGHLAKTIIGDLRNSNNRRMELQKAKNEAETYLKKVALWDEVKDKLHTAGTKLSGGQKQRLCIARALAAKPEILLMDEPCGSLDPIAEGKIEEVIDKLRDEYTIVIVTHSMQQAGRVAQKTAYFQDGEMIEYGDTSAIFTNPQNEKTESFISGRIG